MHTTWVPHVLLLVHVWISHGRVTEAKVLLSPLSFPSSLVPRWAEMGGVPGTSHLQFSPPSPPDRPSACRFRRQKHLHIPLFPTTHVDQEPDGRNRTEKRHSTSENPNPNFTASPSHQIPTRKTHGAFRRFLRSCIGHFQLCRVGCAHWTRSSVLSFFFSLFFHFTPFSVLAGTGERGV